MGKYGDLLTFLTDLDDLIRYHHGDPKKLREIRDTIRHDNFITTEDKNYVQSLIEGYLTDQPLEQPSSRKKSNAKIKLEQRSKNKYSSSESNLSFNFSSNKKFGILGGAAAAIAIITILGFTSINQETPKNTSSKERIKSFKEIYNMRGTLSDKENEMEDALDYLQNFMDKKNRFAQYFFVIS